MRTREFCYQPLETRQHIRLLKLAWIQPSNTNERTYLSGTIQHFPLHNLPRYAALSYCWGLCPPMLEIPMADGKCIQISATLDQALSRLQPVLGHDISYLWVDQVCINQADIKERGHQVSLMSSIYSRAALVVIWLGEDQDGIATRLRRILSTCATYNPGKHVCISKSDCADLLKACAGCSATYLSSPSGARPTVFGPDEMLTVWELLQRSWFTRAWVVQEVAVARHVSFLVGLHLFSLNEIDFLVSLTALAEREADEPPCPGIQFRRSGSFECFHRIIHQRERYHAVPADQNMLPFLSRIAGLCQATDARDMVYAFLGLYQNGQSLLMEPDYSASLQSVFMKLAKALITESSTLDVLAAVTGASDSDNSMFGNRNSHGSSDSDVPNSPASSDASETSQHESATFPSWTPDWRLSLDHAPLYTSWGSPKFSSSGNFLHRAMLDDPPELLTVRGKVIADVDIIQPIRRAPALARGTATLQHQLPMDELLSALRKKRAKSAPALTLERLLRVMIADGSDRGEFSSKIDAARQRLSDRRISELVSAWEMTAFCNDNENTVERIHEDSRVLLQHCRVAAGRMLFATAGLAALGLAPRLTKPGDVVAILHGSRTPVVMRRLARNEFCVIGQCYMEGAMYGECVTWEEDEADTFVLV